MSLNIFTNPQEELNLIICITVTGLPSVIIFTGSGLVEITAQGLPPNLTDAHFLLTAVLLPIFLGGSKGLCSQGKPGPPCLLLFTSNINTSS